jgi:hypothetical protein
MLKNLFLILKTNLNWKEDENLSSRAYTIKLFTAVIYGFSLKATVFVSGKPFQPSLMFVGEARSPNTQLITKIRK